MMQIEFGIEKFILQGTEEEISVNKKAIILSEKI